jgi:Pyruvate/2-oxoacid:ferredoxin oxidoreductase delta subunit
MRHNNPKRTFPTRSTRWFIRAARSTEGFSFFDFMHGYFYARWTYLYIGFGKGDHPLARALETMRGAWHRLFPPRTANKSLSHSLTQASGSIADGYHGKALPLEIARELIMVNEPIRVKDLEQVIPYVRARAILEENPDHIAVLECPCRSSKENPCLPLEVCLIIGEPFASFVTEHHPSKARWISQEEAVEILEAEDQRGHVHHAFFKDAMLGRFYAICNCCSCCCGAMLAHQNGIPMLASSGYVSQVDQELCTGCATCTQYCQFDALSLNDEGYAQVDVEKCMGCGVCVSKCAAEAIALKLAPSKGVPMVISDLVAMSTE